jgi:putative transposase
MAERKGYASDLSDGEWEKIKDDLRGKRDRYGRGRPLRGDVREIVNAIYYVVKTGCQWRMLPHDFPPWTVVYGYFRRWKASGVWVRIHNRLREEVREAAGRERSPSLGIMDTQSVKTAQKGGASALMPEN